MRKDKKLKEPLNSAIDYKLLMKYIDHGDFNKLRSWINENKTKPGFTINQLIPFQNKPRFPLEFFAHKFPDYLNKPLQKEAYHSLLAVFYQRQNLQPASFRHEIFVNFESIKNSIQNILEAKTSTPVSDIEQTVNENIIHLIVGLPKKDQLAHYIPQLAKKGVDINLVNKESQTPLMKAIILNNEEAFKYLLKAGADLGKPTLTSNALDVLIYFKNENLAKILQDHRQNNPLTCSADHFLIVIVLASNVSDLQGCINWAKKWRIPFDINQTDDLCTPLMAAICADLDLNDAFNIFKTNKNRIHHFLFNKLSVSPNQKNDLIKYLLDQKADPELKDKNGDNSLMLAICTNNKEIVRDILLKTDEKILLPTNKAGFNALHLAAMYNLDLIPLLLEKKSDINIRSSKNGTILNMAIQTNNIPMIDLVLNHPAFNYPEHDPISCLIQSLRFDDGIALKKILNFENTISYRKNYIKFYEILIANEKTHPHFKILFNDEKNPDECLPFAFRLSLAFSHLNLIRWLLKKNPAFVNNPVFFDFLKDAFFLCKVKFLISLKKLLEEFDFNLVNFLNFILPGDPDVFELFKTPNRLTHVDKPADTLTSIHQTQIPRFTPHSFFTQCLGLNKNEFSSLLQEDKSRNLIERNTLNSPIPRKISFFSTATWCDQLISSNDPYLEKIENINGFPAHLLIPFSLQINAEAEKVLSMSRIHFHPKRGLKVLKGEHPVQATLTFRNKILELDTYFTHEMTHSGADRILCIKLDADITTRGVIYIAAYFLKAGLHHHRVSLPHKIKITVFNPQMDTNAMQVIPRLDRGILDL